MGRQLGGTGSHKFAFAGAIRVEGSISAVLKESLADATEYIISDYFRRTVGSSMSFALVDSRVFHG